MSSYSYYVYFLTNKTNKVLYIGVTNNLMRRLWEHREKKIKGFTKKYNCTKLVFFEETDDVSIAISREKQLKKWRREKKNALVEVENPEWDNLSDGWFD